MFKKIIILCSLVAIFCNSGIVLAQNTKSELVASQCSQLQTTLKQIEGRDLVSRANMGREYENTGKQLAAFNERVKNNNYNDEQFVSTYTSYQAAVNQFRVAYVTYDDSLNDLIEIDCQSNPDSFLTQLEQTGNLRAAVNYEATVANNLLSQYRELMAQLQAQLPDEETSGDSQ